MPSESDATPPHEKAFVKGIHHYSCRSKQHISSAINSLPPTRGQETILVVDDDSLVRQFVAKVLFDNGYRVIEAIDGVEAASICQCHQGPIHLIVADVVMPHLGGLSLFRRLGTRIPLLLMSGYLPISGSIGGLKLEFEGAPAPMILQKPFSTDLLLQKVQELLDGNDPR